MILFLLKNWKLIIIGALIVALGALYTIDKLRIEHLQNEKGKIENALKQIQIDLTACQEVNKSNVATMDSLQAEAKNVNDLCGQRLKAKDALINDLKKIDQIKEPIDAKDACTINDSLFNALRGMFNPTSDAGDRKSGIPVPGAGSPARTGAVSP